MAYSRTSFTVKTNGQTLAIDADGPGGSAALLHLTTAVSSAVTLPYTITSETTFYIADELAGDYVLSAKQPDGTELYGKAVKLRPGRTVVVEPVPSALQSGADTGRISYSDYLSFVTVGQETVPRPFVTSTVTQTSQRVNFGFFTALKSERCTRVRVDTGSTAAGATPTVCRIGLYTAASDDALTLVASTTNDTALFGTQNTTYTKDLTTAYSITGGTRYAVGILVVTAAAAPTIAGAPMGTALTTITAPRTCGFLTGQADLPASVAAGGLTATTTAPWAVFMPAA